MRLSLKLSLLLSSAALSAFAHASTISFIESTTASGSLNGVGFTAASLTVTGTYNTSNITLVEPEVFAASTALTYTIGGFGFGNFLWQ